MQHRLPTVFYSSQSSIQRFHKNKTTTITAHYGHPITCSCFATCRVNKSYNRLKPLIFLQHHKCDHTVHWSKILTAFGCFFFSLFLDFRYIPPDKREENDQSTHKWMVYVRGSRREPSIDHFVKKVWFFLHPSYKPNDLVEVRFVTVWFSAY